MNFTFSNYTNARSIRVGLRLLGQELWAVGARGFMVPAAPRAPQRGDRLYFTDEASLADFLGRDGFEFEPARYGLPVDDKLAFAEALAAAGAAPVPFARVEDAEGFGFPLLLKGRHSWRGGRPHPRGRRVSSAEELHHALARYESEGFPRDGFFVQRWLPDGIRNCWSVAGWFCARERHETFTFVSRKLLATDDGLGYAIAVGTVPDPAGLQERAACVLEALDYRGPFELEYLQGDDGSFFELELNPRFWLQHSIVVHRYDNFLLKRYNGMPANPPTTVQPTLWVSGIATVLATLRPWRQTSLALVRVVREWRAMGATILVDPPVATSLRVVASDAWRRLTCAFWS